MTTLEQRIQHITVPDYCRRPRTEPISLVCIHATRGKAPMRAQFESTVGWFHNAPDQGGYGPNADILVGARGEFAQFGDWATTHAAFAAGYGQRSYPFEWAVDELALSVEVAQPAGKDAQGRYTDAAWPSVTFEPFTAESIATLAEALRPFVRAHDIPLVRINYWDQNRHAPPPRGFIGHEDTAHGYRVGKSDPGSLFPWEELFAQIAAEPRSEGIDRNPFGEDDDVEIRQLDQGQSIAALERAARDFGAAMNDGLADFRDTVPVTVVEVTSGSPVQPPPGGHVYLFTTKG